MTQKICFIGAGNMGEALLKGLLQTMDAGNIGILEKNKERAALINQTYKTTIINNKKELAVYDTCILAIKPQVMESVLQDLSGAINEKTIIISIAAGITIPGIQTHFPNNKIVRVMPNTPALINEGISGISFSNNCNNTDKETAVKIFEKIGKTLIVPEALINSVTAVSGSGPAYFYHLANVFATNATDIGLNYQDALLLVCQTMLGASKMMIETQENPADLITKVKSPGGTTEAGLNILQSQALSDIIMQTLVAAKTRGDELAT